MALAKVRYVHEIQCCFSLLLSFAFLTRLASARLLQDSPSTVCEMHPRCTQDAHGWQNQKNSFPLTHGRTPSSTPMDPSRWTLVLCPGDP